MNSPAQQAIKILLVDDEAPARNRLREVLSDCAEQQPLTIVGEAANGREALTMISQTPTDLVLLDIRMPEMDGLEVAQHLIKLEKPPAVIFTTAYDNYAINAFELNAVDYLLKPIRAERVMHALQKFNRLSATRLQNLQTIASGPRKHLSVVERNKVILVPMSEIIYLRAELKYVTVKTAAREYLVEESLTKLEQEFSEQFVRIHRNCLVSKDSIKGFEKVDAVDPDNPDGAVQNWVVLLQGTDTKLPVSRRQYHIIRNFKKS